MRRANEGESGEKTETSILKRLNRTHIHKEISKNEKTFSPSPFFALAAAPRAVMTRQTSKAPWMASEVQHADYCLGDKLFQSKCIRKQNLFAIWYKRDLFLGTKESF